MKTPALLISTIVFVLVSATVGLILSCSHKETLREESLTTISGTNADLVVRNWAMHTNYFSTSQTTLLSDIIIAVYDKGANDALNSALAKTDSFAHMLACRSNYFHSVGITNFPEMK